MLNKMLYLDSPELEFFSFSIPEEYMSHGTTQRATVTHPGGQDFRAKLFSGSVFDTQGFLD